ncbi:Fc.00g073400.m01.CDS01 [Cosmosporella sp. VM-42]
MLRIPLLALGLFTLVDAGSRLWEKSLAQSVQLLQAADAQQAAQVENNTLSERWFVPLVPKKDPNNEHDGIWPDKTITWAWADDTAKEMFETPFKDAMKIWRMAGLPEDFKYKEIPLDECTQDEKRTYCLVVSSGTGFDTTPARRRREFGPAAPTMQLDDNPNIGHLDVTLNVAHELGHAWGLLHPHQNPIYWKHTNGATGASSGLIVFDADDPNQYMCENLSGYDQAVRTATIASGGNPDHKAKAIKKLCTSFLFASTYKFRGGANWAPYDPQIKAVSLDTEMDWTSIMIYPSQAGAVTGDDGQRKNILMKPDGTAIPSNQSPSEMDINGIKYLYGWKPKGLRKLIPMKDLKKIRKNDGPDTCDVYKDPGPL